MRQFKDQLFFTQKDFRNIMDHIICPFEIKSQPREEDGCITGYGSIFGNVDSYGNTVAKGSFKKTISDAKSGVGPWPECFRSTAAPTKLQSAYGPAWMKANADSSFKEN
jgi:hypothetical protein